MPAIVLWLFLPLLACAAPARAIDAAQTAAVDRLAAQQVPGRTVAQTMASHYAMLLWVEDYCNGQSDETVRKYIMAKGASDEPQFEAAWLEAMTMLDKTDRVAMCALALAQYGPSGALIERAWQPKPASK